MKFTQNKLTDVWYNRSRESNNVIISKLQIIRDGKIMFIDSCANKVMIIL